MGAQLVNVTTDDAYGDAQTVTAPDAARVNFQIANAAIRYQLGRGWPGVVWGDETMLLPGFFSLDRRCTGVRIRSAAAGTPAQVTVDVVGSDELGGRRA